MTGTNDPNDDAGNRALDYAADNVEAKLAEMDLRELCEELDIGLLEAMEVLNEHNDGKGLWTFWTAILGGLHPVCFRYEYIISAAARLEEQDGFNERFNDMLCAAIRVNETYQRRMEEKLQEQHRAGEVDDWMEQDRAEERAREREES